MNTGAPESLHQLFEALAFLPAKQISDRNLEILEGDLVFLHSACRSTPESGLAATAEVWNLGAVIKKVAVQLREGMAKADGVTVGTL